MFRHEILSDNIANIDTPGFKRSDVSFQQHLARALEPANKIDLKTSSSRHIDPGPTRIPSNVNGRAYIEMDTATRNDKNNVDPEVEMSHISSNTMYFQALSQMVAGNFRSLQTIVTRSAGA